MKTITGKQPFGTNRLNEGRFFNAIHHRPECGGSSTAILFLTDGTRFKVQHRWPYRGAPETKSGRACICSPRFPHSPKSISPVQNFPYLTASIDCLKRFASILLLLILAFNFCGYRLVIGYMKDATTYAVEKKADARDYTDDELLSIKTTLNLPYYTSTNEFERAYGSITVNGQEYEYVKRRVHNDTLELLCLPNAAKTKLKAAGNELSKASADGNASAPTKKSSATIKISLPDFYQTLSVNLTALPPSQKGRHFFPENSSALTGYASLQERPPQVA